MDALGLDLSLTSTGIATKQWTRAIRTKKLTSYERLRFIRSAIIDAAAEVLPDLVVVEGPAYAAVGKGQHERGGLWWMVTEALDDAGLQLAVVPPSSLKKFAVGVGAGPRSDKNYVTVAAARHFWWFDGGNDEADALWLCAMGHEWAGDPITHIAKAHLVALDGCRWPATTVDAPAA